MPNSRGRMAVYIEGHAESLEAAAAKGEVALGGLEAKAKQTNEELALGSGGFAKYSSTTAKSAKETEHHTRATDKLGSVLKGAAASTGAFVGAYVGYEAVKDAAEYTEQLAHQTEILTNVTGLDSRAASQWIELAKQREIATSKVQIGFTTLSKQIRAADTGNATAAKGFHALGIPLKELDELSTEEVLNRISDGLAKTDDKAKRAALTQQFFGKSGRELLPILGEGSKALKDQLDKFSGLSEAQEHQAHEVREWQRNISRTYDQVRIDVSFAMLNAAKSVKGWIQDLRQGKGDVATTMRDIGQFFGHYIGDRIEDAENYFKGFAKVVEGVCELVQGILHGEFSKAWKGIKDIFSGGVEATLAILHTMTAPAAAITGKIGEGLEDGFSAVWDGIKSVFRNGVNDVIGFLNDLIEAINVIPGIPNIDPIGEIGGGSGTKPAKKENPRATGYEVKGSHKHAAGGPVRVGGSGREDTVPLYRDELMAMVAPGEDLFVANRHQRPMLDEAVRNQYGVNGLDGFYETFKRPHNMASGGQVPGFLNGGDVLGAIGSAASAPVGVAKSAFNTAKGAIGGLPSPHLSPWIQGVGTYAVHQLADWITSGFSSGKLGSHTISSNAHGTLSSGQFIKAAREALQLTGHGGVKGGARKLLSLSRQESGLNADSINTYDSNALAGNPSRGLMEITESNFRAYHQKGTSWDINDPVANIAASVNYQYDRYGALVTHSPYARGGRIRAYKAGGKVKDDRQNLSNTTGPATAPSVIAWAQHHLGNNDKWGYPGEWCGAFMGADMLAHGIQPPAGYPLASAWSSWGTPGDSGAGNVVVIGGSGHVGLSLGGGKMISGNFSDSVAVSTIAEAAGGRPITGYRKPPYSSAATGTAARGKSAAPKTNLHTALGPALLAANGLVAGLPTAVGTGTALSAAGLSAGALSGAALGLPASAQALLQQPGLTYSQQLEVGGYAKDLAGGTEGTADDVAAATYTLGLEQSHLAQVQKQLKKTSKQLKKARSVKAQKRILKKQERLVADYAGTSSEISSDEATINDAQREAEVQMQQEILAATEAQNELLRENAARQIRTERLLTEQSGTGGTIANAIGAIANGGIGGKVGLGFSAPTTPGKVRSF